jgi:hypothetical protein
MGGRGVNLGLFLSYTTHSPNRFKILLQFVILKINYNAKGRIIDPKIYKDSTNTHHSFPPRKKKNKKKKE